MRGALRIRAMWKPSRRTLSVGILIGVIALGCSQPPAVKKQRYLEQGTAFYNQGKYNEAIIELRNALQLDQECAPALHLLGRAYRAKSWHVDAVRELGRAAGADPDNVDIQVDLGRAYLDLELWDAAEAQGKKVQAKDPSNP